MYLKQMWDAYELCFAGLNVRYWEVFEGDKKEGRNMDGLIS